MKKSTRVLIVFPLLELLLGGLAFYLLTSGAGGTPASGMPGGEFQARVFKVFAFAMAGLAVIGLLAFLNLRRKGE
jgi:hypothetical protein